MFARFDELFKVLRKLSSELQREKTPLILVPSSQVFLISIRLEDRNVFARYDEIPSMAL